MHRKFVVTPGEFGPAFIEVDDESYLVIADEDDLPAELKMPHIEQNKPGSIPWFNFMENAPDNTRVCIADVKELWREDA